MKCFSIDNNITSLGTHVECAPDGFPDWLSSDALDKFYDLIYWTRITLDQAYEGAPDALAKDYYGTESLYWVPMLFNGLTSYQQFRQGVQLRMPRRQDLFALLSASNTSRPVQSKVSF